MPLLGFPLGVPLVGEALVYDEASVRLVENPQVVVRSSVTALVHEPVTVEIDSQSVSVRVMESP